MTTVTLRYRRRRDTTNSTDAAEAIQLYRIAHIGPEAQLLLERENLTENDIRQFCSGSVTGDASLSRIMEPTTATTTPPTTITVESSNTTGTTTSNDASNATTDTSSSSLHSMSSIPGRRSFGTTSGESETPYQKRVQQYRLRRMELYDLARKYQVGEARIDDDGRLVAVSNPLPPPGIDLPPPPPPPPAAAVDGNGAAHNPPPPPPQQQQQQHDQILLPIENEDEDPIWLQQQERLAAAVIARTVQRYMDQGVALEDLQLVPVGPLQHERHSFTLRRICIAVTAVITAFICIMLQTLPLFQTTKHSDSTMDPLMWELLNVKRMVAHNKDCPGLNRQSHHKAWYEPLLRGVFAPRKTVSNPSGVDCSEGVLHIPARKVIVDAFLKSKTSVDIDAIEPFITNELNLSWWFPCQSLTPLLGKKCLVWPHDSPYSQQPKDLGQLPPQCFRGVHDGLVSATEVANILEVGAQYIAEGGDHFDIRFDVLALDTKLPVVVAVLHQLLTQQYRIAHSVQPVAFRIQAVGPLDGIGVPLFGIRATNPLVQLLNRTRYIEWIEKVQRRNDIAQYSLPWPFAIRPIRETCHLLADLEADPRFAIHTTVFLSEGAGEDYRGGVTLFVDDRVVSSQRKITKGLTVDGTRGRVVVSTGGLENKRCRLPVRAGIRAALQIWWSCEETIESKKDDIGGEGQCATN